MDKQIIPIKAYNAKADYVYYRLNKYAYIEIEGSVETNGFVIVNNINKIT